MVRICYIRLFRKLLVTRRGQSKKGLKKRSVHEVHEHFEDLFSIKIGPQWQFPKKFILIGCFLMANSYAWNMQGHQIVAQIAYDNLTPKAKKLCQHYLNPRSKKSLNTRFINAAIWADQIRFRNINWYDVYHYIDIPFSTDNTPLPPIESSNAVWAINHALKILSSKKAIASDKKLALLILIHVVGDIHQPLHATTRVSSQLPQGDLGGNLFTLASNSVGNNLHKYWDNGAGYFTGYSSIEKIKNKAKWLEKKWPCVSIETEKNVEQWARSSHELALNHAYKININQMPSKQYQLNSEKVVQKQTAIAGCHLAALLNEVDK